jgi:hypothetical protein
LIRDLEVKFNGSEIIITRPGTDFMLAFHKASDRPNLILTRSWEKPTVTSPEINEFRAHAFQLAVGKADFVMQETRPAVDADRASLSASLALILPGQGMSPTCYSSRVMIGYPCLVSRFLRLARPEMKLTSEAEYVGDVESEPRGFDLTSKITVCSGTSHHRLLAGTSRTIRFGTYNYDSV